MSPKILQIANGFWVWVLAALTVSMVLVQAVLYTRLAYTTADKIGYAREKCRQAFRTGLVTAIGPSIAIFIVMVGMMSVVGGPITWLRLSVIGAAPTELTAATVGAQARGVEFGGADYDLLALATSWWTMAINGFGWLLFVSLFTHKLEDFREKIGGGDPKWLAALSGAAMLGVFGYLNTSHVLAGGGRLIAVVTGAIAMVILLKLAERAKWLREYTLGIAMLIGMALAVWLG
ncbi:MAG TPA: DUF5058 family protein [Firmicutes bacterium]|nr:hypothetical protein [Bacillota bacterium]HHV58344.1 DUF5058 family protein [Bacillota bacterium]